MSPAKECGVILYLIIARLQTIGIFLCVDIDVPRACSANLVWYSWIVVISGVRYLSLKEFRSAMLMAVVASVMWSNG